MSWYVYLDMGGFDQPIHEFPTKTAAKTLKKFVNRKSNKKYRIAKKIRMPFYGFTQDEICESFIIKKMKK